ncbi:DUF6017 domain-containing protein [[Clostridium] colinum]|uniref:DUF6017 domain-containing protein n=1 Tax=[Clostridium] colinum TaxID=36835 RepID=UPI0020242773|nr:DUF6017 domain-containing protein [[Clostridium] colinum]
MEKVIVRKDLVQITNDFIMGVILNEIIEIAQRFRKEFIDNNWHCPEFFEINIEKISKDNMLNLSKSSIRRYIKKLESLGFLTIDRLEKKHRYRVNFDAINEALQKIGGDTIERNKKNYKYKEIKDNENLEDNKTNNIHNFESKKEMVEPHKKENKVSQTISLIKNNINYNIINEMCQDIKNEHFVNMFDSVYRVIIDVMTTDSEYIKINKENKPAEIVRGVFSKINDMDILDIIERLKRVGTRIINFKNYMITTIYNHYIEKEYKLQNDLYINEGILL